MANIGKPQRRIIVVPVRKTEPVSPRPEPEREREPSPTILPAPEKEKEKVSA